MICNTCKNRFICPMNYNPDRKECEMFELVDENEVIMIVAKSMVQSIIQTAAGIVEEELSDKRLYFKIYCDSEPNEIAEKIYQLCGDRKKLIEVWERIGEYIESESESEGTTD